MAMLLLEEAVEKVRRALAEVPEAELIVSEEYDADGDGTAGTEHTPVTRLVVVHAMLDGKEHRWAVEREQVAEMGEDEIRGLFAFMCDRARRKMAEGRA